MVATKPVDRQKALTEETNKKKARQANKPAIPTPPSETLELDESFRSASGDPDETMDFEDENGIDDSGAHSKLGAVKVAYDASDPDFFFINLESAMSYAGIKSQQSKRFCLLGVLPNEVKIQFKGVIKATATGELGL